MTLLEHIMELTEDMNECRRLMKEVICSEFIDGNVDESGIEAFKTVNSMMIHMAETMEREAALLTSIEYKLDKLLEMKKN